MADLAVIVPTRSRPKNLPGIVEAWHQTGGFGPADLCVVYDADDLYSDDYEQLIGSMPGVRSAVRPHWEPMVHKLNWAAVKLAEEYKYVAFMGDDHLPRTQLWAHKLIAGHLLGGSRKIVYGRDGIQDRRLPTWWSMDSRLIKALGKMVPSEVQHLFCDNAIMALGQAANCLIYDETILVEHMHPFAGKAPSDQQYQRVNRQQQYDRDGMAFRDWMADGLWADVNLIRSAGR